MRVPVQRGAGDIGAEDPQLPEQVLRRPGVALAAGFALDQRAVDAAAVGAAAVIIDGIDEKFKDEPDLLAFGRFGRDLGEENSAAASISACIPSNSEGSAEVRKAYSLRPPAVVRVPPFSSQKNSGWS